MCLVNLLNFVTCSCAYHGGSFGRGQTKALTCSQPKVGRFVFVKLRVNEYLTLCEVEVMAVKCMYLLTLYSVIVVDEYFTSPQT